MLLFVTLNDKRAEGIIRIQHVAHTCNEQLVLLNHSKLSETGEFGNEGHIKSDQDSLSLLLNRIASKVSITA